MTKPTNIVILGAGITGLMNAYTLHKHGHTITLCDPAGFPADNASAMAGGMLAPYSEIEHMDMEWIKAGLHGIQTWKNLALDCGFENNGSLLIAHPDDRYILERFKSHLPPHLQKPQITSDLESSISDKFKTGLFLNEEAHLDPQKTMRALCEYLSAQDNVTLNAEHQSPNGKNLTIDCRGMGADDPKIRGVKGEILIAHNPDFTLTRPVRMMHPRYPLYIIPRDDHHFMIGATQIESSEDNAVTIRSAMELMSALYALHPSFAEASIVEIKAGIRPSYPDNLPRITIENNTISCNGLFRHGYLLAPVIAECVADHLAGKENEFMSLFNKGSNNENNNQRAA